MQHVLCNSVNNQNRDAIAHLLSQLHQATQDKVNPFVMSQTLVIEFYHNFGESVKKKTRASRLPHFSGVSIAR